jgi:predicted metal-dependent hydrolase
MHRAEAHPLLVQSGVFAPERVIAAAEACIARLQLRERQEERKTHSDVNHGIYDLHGVSERSHGFKAVAEDVVLLLERGRQLRELLHFLFLRISAP